MSDCGCSIRTPIEKGFALERKPPIAGELKDVARRVPARDDDARGLDRFASARAGVLQHDRANRTARQLDISQAGKETHLATCGDNTLANALHDGGQLVGTDRGFACQRISSGAPAWTNASSTWRICGLFVPVVSLPSENVPAPPSPNCTFAAASSGRPR